MKHSWNNKIFHQCYQIAVQKTVLTGTLTKRLSVYFSNLFSTMYFNDFFYLKGKKKLSRFSLLKFNC